MEVSGSRLSLSLSLSLSLFIGFFMTRNPMFYYSLAVLVLGILSGLYLFFEWLRHDRRYKFPLFWGVGLFLLYWFQIPFILANAGVHFTLTDFNVFFSLAFPMTFGGLLLVYLGILSVAPISNQKKINRYLLWWFVANILVFFFHFIIKGGVQTNYVLLFVTNLLFFLPLRILILFTLWKWLRRQDWVKTKLTSIGIMLMMGWDLIGAIGSIIVIPKLLLYPPQFWFIGLLEFKFLAALQITSMLLLLTGFLFVHRNCFRNLDGAARYKISG